MESNDSSKISWPSEYFKHISRHSGNIKVGVNQKKKTIKKTKLMCFVRKKGWSKYAKQNKSFKLEFSKKKRARQFVLFLTIGVVQKRAFERWSDFCSEKNYFAVFEKTKVVPITFRLRQIPRRSLKEINFSTRNAPDRF